MKVEVLYPGLNHSLNFQSLIFLNLIIRLIKHTEQLLDEKEEKLCIKVLQTLKDMMTVDIDYGEKVRNFCFFDFLTKKIFLLKIFNFIITL